MSDRARNVDSCKTYNNTIGAINSGTATFGSRADTDNTDGAASKANEAVDVASVDTEEAEDGSGSGRGGLLMNKQVSILK